MGSGVQGAAGEPHHLPDGCSRRGVEYGQGLACRLGELRGGPVVAEQAGAH